jgi:crossover junction endodeoxyribonuclease RuvC
MTSRLGQGRGTNVSEERERILGIDPGTVATGWGVVEITGGALVHLDHGTIGSSSGLGQGLRLKRIYHGLQEIFARYEPQGVSLEKVFFARNAASALKLGQARGVALLAAAQALVPVAEYYPNVVKLSVAGHGGADKAQVGRMVSRLLGVGEALSSDASDACAIAITHVVRHGLDARLALVSR